MADTTTLPPFRPLPQKAPDIEMTKAENGVVYLKQRHAPGPRPRTIGHCLDEKAAEHASRIFLKERNPATDRWDELTYGEAKTLTDSLAQAFLNMRDKGENFSDYVWSFVGGKPIQNAWHDRADVPAKTPESENLSKDLKKRGFKFVGPVIVYAFMQAVGMVNDHTTDCHCYERVKGMG